MNKNFGLGRGLDSLLPQINSSNSSDPANNFLLDDENEKIIYLSPLEIKVNPFQPRKDFNRRELDELVDSIREHGIIQPLVVISVDDGYQLIAGERRLRASQILELEKVPVVLRKASSIEQLELALIENIQRSNLNPVEEALAYRRLADEFNFTQEQIAKKVGKGRPTVANIMRVLNLPEEIRDALSAGRISLGQAEQRELYQKCLVGDMNITELTREATKINRKITRTTKDLQTEIKEDKMRQVLGTKVYIKRHNGKGKVEIEFYSDEDLDKIIEQICD
jgi:ParB family chromosome partitioning protein